MKTKLLTLMLFLLSLKSYSLREKTFGLNVISSSESSLDGNVSIDVEYFIHFDCLIPNPELSTTFPSSQLAKPDQNRFSGESYLAGAASVFEYYLNYDLTTLPFFPKSFK
jgi:hypothetical protein